MLSECKQQEGSGAGIIKDAIGKFDYSQDTIYSIAANKILSTGISASKTI
jgi:hypothetical protein